MIEKVNPMHPDKIADRIAGAITDLAYSKNENPIIATEVLVGHGKCTIISETNVTIMKEEVDSIVERISGDDQIIVDFTCVKQDEHLAENQNEEVRCGDNGIFLGLPLTEEELKISQIAKTIYWKYPYDGKFILNIPEPKEDELTICQSNAKSDDIKFLFPYAKVNPLGEWTGGINVDTGATNRKLGSDMGHSVTGGGLHGKDLSKADVAVNIYVFNMAQNMGRKVEAICSIGDRKVTISYEDYYGSQIRNKVPYSEIVESAKKYIAEKGGFEKFAEWGLF